MRLAPERAENVLARITPPTRSRALEPLRWMDAKTIAALIEEEHPQIAAIVLAHLEPPIAADVLQLLPSDVQPDVIYRVAKLESVSAEAIEELEKILVRQVARDRPRPRRLARRRQRGREDHEQYAPRLGQDASSAASARSTSSSPSGSRTRCSSSTT